MKTILKNASYGARIKYKNKEGKLGYIWELIRFNIGNKKEPIYKKMYCINFTPDVGKKTKIKVADIETGTIFTEVELL